MTTLSFSRFSLSAWLGLFVFSLMLAPPVLAQKEYTGGALHFKFNIPQLERLTLEVVDGLEWVTEGESSLGGTEKMYGKTTMPTITFRHVANGSDQVWHWYRNPDSRPGSIDLVDDAGNKVRTYALPMMIPTMYRLVDTPEGVVEELEVVTLDPKAELN